MNDFEQWAQGKADEVKKRNLSKEAAKQALIEDKALTSQQAPQLWQEVWQAIVKQTDIFSKKLPPEIPVLRITPMLENIIEISTLVNTSEIVIAVAKFNPDTNDLSMTVRNNHVFKAEVRSGKVWFCQGAGGGQIAPIHIAQLFVGEIADTL
jgi:hypothetical protein